MIDLETVAIAGCGRPCARAPRLIHTIGFLLLWRIAERPPLISTAPFLGIIG